MTAPPRDLLLVDDEPLARERLRHLLAAHPGWRIVGECEDGDAAVDAILAHRPDLVLLDIRMPALGGTDVVRRLREAWPAGERLPAIVFVTAYDAHAIEAFALAAFDYLLKPVDAPRLAEALARVAERHPVDWATRFMARDAKGAVHAVPVEEIVRAEARGNYVRLHAGTRVHFVRDTITRFAERLDPSQFLRIHRSTVVALRAVRRIEPRRRGDYLVTLHDGTRLPSSRRYAAALRALLGRRTDR